MCLISCHVEEKRRTQSMAGEKGRESHPSWPHPTSLRVNCVKIESHNKKWSVSNEMRPGTENLREGHRYQWSGALKAAQQHSYHTHNTQYEHLQSEVSPNSTSPMSSWEQYLRLLLPFWAAALQHTSS